MLTAWISTEAQTTPPSVTDRVVAGAVLSVIVVVVFVTAIGVVIWRYRLLTYCCVNTLTILVLELYFNYLHHTD